MKTLETYIDKARRAKSAERLVSPDVLRSIVENTAATHDVQTLPTYGFFPITLTKGIIMTSIAALLVAAGVLWLNSGWLNPEWLSPGAPTPPPAQNAETTRGSAPQHSPQLSALPSAAAPTTTKEQTQNISSLQQSTTSLVLSRNNTARAIPIVDMSREDLTPLGISATAEGYTFTIEERFGGMQNLPRFIAAHHYDTGNPYGIFRARVQVKGINVGEPNVLPYDGSWDIATPLALSPVAIVVYTNHKHSSSSSTSSFASRRHPAFSDDIMAELRRELTQLGKDIDNSTDDRTQLKVLPTARRNYKYLQYLLPVVLHMETDSTVSSIVVAYPVNSLLPLLPARIVAALRQIYPTLPQTALPYTYTGKSDAIEAPKAVVAKSIAGIQSIELSSEEAERLGVSITNDGVSCVTESLLRKVDMVEPTVSQPIATDTRKATQKRQEMRKLLQALGKEGYDTSAKYILYRQQHVMLLGKKQKSHYIPYTGWDYTLPSPIMPVGYSLARCWYAYNEKQEEYNQNIELYSDVADNSPLLADNNKELFVRNDGGVGMGTGIAIPVQIELGSLKDSKPNSIYPNSGADTAHYQKVVVQLWFVPNREFVAALPERYRLPLMKELALYERVTKGELLPEQACGELQQKSSYLDMCRFSSGVIRTFSIAPNPATTGSSNCHFTLREDSECSLALYTSAGALVKTIIPSTTFSAGRHEYRLALEGVKSGVYLVSLITSQGDQSVQRLIVP